MMEQQKISVENFWTNKFTLNGRWKEEFKFYYENEWGKFYKNYILVERLSGTVDEIPVVIPEKSVPSHPMVGRYTKVEGYIRSRNVNHHLIVYAYAKNLFDILEEEQSENKVILEGLICRKPILRYTPLGKTISEFSLKIRRENGKFSRIPCIAWGKKAYDISQLADNAKIHVEGRFQSRKYVKHIDDGTDEERTTYELSIYYFE